MNKETEEIIQKAQEILEGMDVVFDLYDFSVVWASDKIIKISGFSEDEISTKRMFDLVDVPEKQLREIVARDLAEMEGKKKFLHKTKDGSKVPFVAEFKVMEFAEGIYLVGKGDFTSS